LALKAGIVVLLATSAAAQSTGPAPQGAWRNNYYDGYGYHDRQYRTVFSPGQVAPDVVGRAIGTTGAIATFRGLTGYDTYAMSSNASYCAQRYRL